MTPNAPAARVDESLADKLRWCAEPHVTREYRALTIGEQDARRLAELIEAANDCAGAFEEYLEVMRVGQVVGYPALARLRAALTNLGSAGHE